MSTVLKLAGPTIRRGKSLQVVETPDEFILAVTRKFGPIAVDLAATNENAKAPIYIDPETDTFKQDWVKWLRGGLGWLNPEFDPMDKWLDKCVLERRRGAQFLVLTPASIGANWFWDYVRPFATTYSIGRLQFVGHTHSYPKDLLVNHYHDNPSPVIQRWRWKGELT